MTAFELTATDGAARAGVLTTAHGEVRTPVFMPVGTKATVKTLHPDEVRALGAQIVLGNTYHLHFRPGDELIAELGGLHRFMAWDGPILTDSGGFQVFSLRDTLLAVDDDGVTFRNVYDGAATRFTPELAVAIQRNLGSDIAMCLDHVPPAGIARARTSRCGEAHDRVGARASAHAERAPGQLRFAINQGGTDAELRRRSVEELLELDFDGNAIGGLAIGEDRGAMFETTDWVTALLPAEKPRYFMGIGDAEGILEVIEAGRRHVRLRAADAHRAHRQRDHVGGPAEPAQRALRPRPAPARRELRLPGVHHVHAGLHPPSREPGRGARPPPPVAPQSTLPPRAHPPRARGDRAAHVRLLQTRRPGAPRCRP